MKRRSPKSSRDPQETRPSGRVQRRGPRGGQYISPEKRKWIQEKIRTMRHEGYPPLVAIAAAHRMAGIQRPKRPVKHLTPGEHKQLMKARHKDPKLRWIYAGGRRPKARRDPESSAKRTTRSARDTASFHSKREAETFQHALFMHGHKRAILAETRTGYAVIYPESVPHHVVQAAKTSVSHRASSWEEDYPESSPTLRMQRRPAAGASMRDPGLGPRPKNLAAWMRAHKRRSKKEKMAAAGRRLKKFGARPKTHRDHNARMLATQEQSVVRMAYELGAKAESYRLSGMREKEAETYKILRALLTGARRTGHQELATQLSKEALRGKASVRDVGRDPKRRSYLSWPKYVRNS